MVSASVAIFCLAARLVMHDPSDKILANVSNVSFVYRCFFKKIYISWMDHMMPRLFG